MESGSTINLALNSIKITETFSVDEVRTLQKFKIEELLESLDNTHKSVRGTLSESRKETVDRPNK